MYKHLACTACIADGGTPEGPLRLDVCVVYKHLACTACIADSGLPEGPLRLDVCVVYKHLACTTCIADDGHYTVFFLYVVVIVQFAV